MSEDKLKELQEQVTTLYRLMNNVVYQMQEFLDVYKQQVLPLLKEQQ